MQSYQICEDIVQRYQTTLRNINPTRNISIMSGKLAVAPPDALKKPINVPEKTLMGPGPSNVSKRVLDAQALPTLGHLHPEYCQVGHISRVFFEKIFNF